MVFFPRHTPTKWNVFSMRFRSGGRRVIINNLQGILFIVSRGILQFWEGSSSYRNSFLFWLYPLLKKWGNLSLTNCKNNCHFMFPSYWKHLTTPLPWEMLTINLALHPTVPSLLSLVLHSWCNPPLHNIEVLGVLACCHGSVLWTEQAPSR